MATPTENCEIKNNEVKTGNKPGQIAPELAKYLDNPFVSEIHGNRIFYTNEFYVAMAKRIHDEEMTYEDAYESLGFHVSDLGINRAQQAGKNAMEKFKQGKFIPKPGSYDGSIIPREKLSRKFSNLFPCRIGISRKSCRIILRRLRLVLFTGLLWRL